MSVVRAAEAPTFNLPGIRFVGLTAPSRGASEICTWHLHVEPRAPSGEPHWLDHEEVFILLEGKLHVVMNDVQVSLAAGDALAVPANAPTFTMPQTVVSGSVYAVTVQTQPTGEVCTVANGTATMPPANVTNVAVTCSAQAYTVGGTITGLNAGGLLVVSNLVLANGADTLTVLFGATTFTFSKPVAFGSSYDVVVQSQPSLLGLVQLTCSVSAGSGVMGAGNVTNVVVTCL